MEINRETSETQERMIEEATDDQLQHATDTNDLHGVAASDPPGTVIPDYVIQEEDRLEDTNMPFRGGKGMTESDDIAHRCVNCVC